MYALTLTTPLGRMLNAVRDNPERVEFIGYTPSGALHRLHAISGFFMPASPAGWGPELQIVTAEVVGAARSGASYLLFTFLGGATFFSAHPARC